MKNSENKFSEMIVALDPIGFTYIGNGVFRHRILAIEFDFSANSIEGIVNTIFTRGIEVGRKELQTKLCRNLGI